MVKFYQINVQRVRTNCTFEQRQVVGRLPPAVGLILGDGQEKEEQNVQQCSLYTRTATDKYMGNLS